MERLAAVTRVRIASWLRKAAERMRPQIRHVVQTGECIPYVPREFSTRPTAGRRADGCRLFLANEMRSAHGPFCRQCRDKPLRKTWELRGSRPLTARPGGRDNGDDRLRIRVLSRVLNSGSLPGREEG